MSTVTLRHLGRALSVFPADAVGENARRGMVIVVSNREQASAANGWETSYYQSEEACWWLDTDKEGREYFCAFSGYFNRARDYLVKRHGADGVTIEYAVPHGLCAPDMEFLRYVKWRQGQPPVVAAILAHQGGQVLCDVGFGKSFICSRIARAYSDAKVVFAAPYKSIAREVYDDMRLLVPDVGLVGAGKRDPNRITVAVFNSLKYAPRDANLVLIDEAHKFLTPDYLSLLTQFTRAKLFAFTATPDGRGDTRDGYLEAMFGPVICDVTYAETVKTGGVVPLRVYAYPVSQGVDVRGVTDDTKRNRIGLWTNGARNATIVRAVNEVLAEEGDDAQVLIMCDRTEHALTLSKLFPDYALVHGPLDAKRRKTLEKLGVLLPGQTTCSEKAADEYKRAFSAGTLRRAIATHVWSTGVNFPDLRILVRADGTSSPIASGQIPGRLSRLSRDGSKQYGILIDFRDSFCEAFAKRWSKRERVYRSREWDVIHRT